MADFKLTKHNGEDLPDFADKICAQHSVSFDTARNRRTAQAFEYGSKQWDEFHTHARNSIESLNNQVKSGGTEHIESASRRRVRGFGAAQIIVTMSAAPDCGHGSQRPNRRTYRRRPVRHPGGAASTPNNLPRHACS